MSTYRGVNAHLASRLNSVLNVKAVVGTLNQEKALEGAFSMIVQLHRLIVCSTNLKMFTGILTQPTGDGFLLAALVPGGQLRVEEEHRLRVEQTRPVQRARVRGGGGHSSDMQ